MKKPIDRPQSTKNESINLQTVRKDRVKPFALPLLSELFKPQGNQIVDEGKYLFYK